MSDVFPENKLPTFYFDFMNCMGKKNHTIIRINWLSEDPNTKKTLNLTNTYTPITHFLYVQVWNKQGQN